LVSDFEKAGCILKPDFHDDVSIGMARTVSPQAFLNAEQRGGTANNGKPSLTYQQAGFTLIGGEPGWSGVLGAPFNVTYAYRSTAPASMPDDAAGFSRFNAAQIAQAELALQSWSDLANIVFTRVGAGASGEEAYSNSASILLANYSSGVEGAAAFGNYPGNTSFSSESGDVWVNSSLSYNRTPTAGAYGALVLVHEVGHAIGLAHPSGYNASADGSIEYATDADYYEDSNQYTVMSYFEETYTGGDYKVYYPAAPQLDDISAAQQEYGANLNTRTGDTVYGFGSTADRPWFLATSANSPLIFAVWDAGGVDTFNFSGYAASQVIDLSPGHFSNVGGMVGNVAIAMQVGIENAIGGSGADTLLGNALANVLQGGIGADFLSGLQGDDTLEGGPGDDTLAGDAGADTMRGGAGSDAYWVDSAGDVIVELAGDGFDTVAASVSYALSDNIEKLILQGSAGYAIGNALANFLTGDDLGNTLDGGAGADTMSGGLGDDAYWVDNAGDAVVELAGGGFDTVASFVNYTLSDNIEKLLLLGQAVTAVGNAASNILVGDALGNTLWSLAGNDTLDGGTGADTMIGGLGDDAYWVDAAGDAIVELVGEGFDTVATFVNYTLSDNIEKLILLGSAAYGGGNAQANILVGGALDNTLMGGGGADWMEGGAGNDAYWVDNAGDLIVELVGGGFDTVASVVSYTLADNVEKLILLDSAVIARGNAGGNILVGNTLGNTINGLGGDDWLEGGAGVDHFVFGPGAGHDRIVDFGLGGEHDVLDLSAYVTASVTWSVTQQGADTLVAFANGDSVLLADTLQAHVVQNGGELVWT
jgi:serralysin